VIRRLTILALALVLTACASTRPMADRPGETEPPALPTTTPGTAPAAPRPTATSAPAAPAATQAPLALTEDEYGPVTPMMAQIGLSGERHSAVGDPNAPLTMIEFSDFG
jgi:hypothetical protein